MKFLISALLLLLSPIAQSSGSSIATLMGAIESRGHTAMNGLLDSIDDINARQQGYTAIFRAVKLDDPVSMQLLHRAGAIYRAEDFLYASEHGNTDAVKLFLAADLPVNSADPYEMTTLIHAALNGHYEVVKPWWKMAPTLKLRKWRKATPP